MAAEQLPKTVWLEENAHGLLGFLQVRDLARLTAVSKSIKKQLEPAVRAARQHQTDSSSGALEAFGLEQALSELNSVLAEAEAVTRLPAKSLQTAHWQLACQELESMEGLLKTEMRYVYGPDWDVKPGKLVSRKGTWLKTCTRFSWELSETDSENQKLYLPQGVAMPVLQIGKVTDVKEIHRHEWAGQHLRVWMKPPILRTLEARRGLWYVYAPHFEDKGLAIVAAVDTWLKRTTQMSGELQNFELIYVPKGVPIQLSQRWGPVEEEWEKNRHQHVHLHRQVMLIAPPLTVKQDQYDILVGQGENRLI